MTTEALPSDVLTFEPSYALQPDQVAALSERLLTERPPTVVDQYVSYLIDGTDELSNLGRHIEGPVFMAAFKNDEAKMKQLYGPQEASSQIFVVIDQDLVQPSAAMRVTRESEAGLGTLQAIESKLGVTRADFARHHGVKPGEPIWDVGTAAVPEALRSVEDHILSNILYRSMHLRALHEGIKHYVCINDEGIQSTFDFVGIPFKPIADSQPFDFEGSEKSLAMYGDVSTFIGGVANNYARADNSIKPFLKIYHDRLAEGQGIDQRLMFDF